MIEALTGRSLGRYPFFEALCASVIEAVRLAAPLVALAIDLQSQWIIFNVINGLLFVVEHPFVSRRQFAFIGLLFVVNLTALNSYVLPGLISFIRAGYYSVLESRHFALFTDPMTVPSLLAMGVLLFVQALKFVHDWRALQRMLPDNHQSAVSPWPRLWAARAGLLVSLPTLLLSAYVVSTAPLMPHIHVMGYPIWIEGDSPVAWLGCFVLVILFNRLIKAAPSNATEKASLTAHPADAQYRIVCVAVCALLVFVVGAVVWLRPSVGHFLRTGLIGLYLAMLWQAFESRRVCLIFHWPLAFAIALTCVGWLMAVCIAIFVLVAASRHLVWHPMSHSEQITRDARLLSCNVWGAFLIGLAIPLVSAIESQGKYELFRVWPTSADYEDQVPHPAYRRAIKEERARFNQERTGAASESLEP